MENLVGASLESWCALFGKSTESDTAIRAGRTDARLGWTVGAPIPDESVSLVMGGPPYACGVTYPSGHDDKKSPKQIEEELRAHLQEIARVLQPGRYAFIILPLLTIVDGKTVCWLDLGVRLMEASGMLVGVPPLIITFGDLVIPVAEPRGCVRFGINADIILFGSRGRPAFDSSAVADLDPKRRSLWFRNV